mmetsp:Transcript_6264/g.10550  ORF Transcript_6264/g.10550 Transcript_6264/m.10550 type:complete len:287 (+) Transcript_6264:51-911(+)
MSTQPGLRARGEYKKPLPPGLPPPVCMTVPQPANRFIEERRLQERSIRNFTAKSDLQETSIWSPEILEVVAHRGEDGRIGLDIRHEPSLKAYNVVVEVSAGSQAEREGLIKPGDVLLEVDGLQLWSYPQGTADWYAIGVEDAIQAGQPSYTFKLLRQPRMSSKAHQMKEPSEEYFASRKRMERARDMMMSNARENAKNAIGSLPLAADAQCSPVTSTSGNGISEKSKPDPGNTASLRTVFEHAAALTHVFFNLDTCISEKSISKKHLSEKSAPVQGNTASLRAIFL